MHVMIILAVVLALLNFVIYVYLKQRADSIKKPVRIEQSQLTHATPSKDSEAFVAMHRSTGELLVLRITADGMIVEYSQGELKFGLEGKERVLKLLEVLGPL